MQNDKSSPMALFMSEIRRYKRLVKEDEIMLAMEYQKTGNIKARNALVNANLALVIWLSKQTSAWSNSSLQPSEIISIGLEHLLKAANAWKPNGDAAFAAFAKPFILRGISRSGDKEDRIIMLPLNIAEKIRKMRYHERKLLQQLGRAPKVTELAQSTGFSHDRIQDLQQIILRNPISLDVLTTQKDSHEDEN